LAKFDWTPIGIGEVQLEHCLGWASSLFGVDYNVRENTRGRAPFVVETTQRLTRGQVAYVPEDYDNVMLALQGASSLQVINTVRVPRWSNVSRFARALKEMHRQRREKSKEECKYMVASNWRTKKATELFFDQGG
jgi:hypothetical protein